MAGEVRNGENGRRMYRASDGVALAVRYAEAVALVGAACMLRLALPGPLGQSYLPFYAAVVAAAAFAGAGPGLLAATALSALAVSLLFDTTPAPWTLAIRQRC